MAVPQQPFEYEDKRESVIQSIINRNNQFDPTGKLNDLLIPAKRIQQRLGRARWYKPEQHAKSPYMSASITAPPILSLESVYYPITVTLHHLENAVGNPEAKPVTVDLNDVCLSSIATEDEIEPWLLLHESKGVLKEIDAERQGHGPADINELFETDTGVPEPPEVKAENGFVTLAVGKSITFEVQWQRAGRLVRRGERYGLCFRGAHVWWWRWGSLEEIEGERKVEQSWKMDERLYISCTNVVEFSVEGI
jgi:hypothetical protein